MIKDTQLNLFNQNRKEIDFLVAPKEWQWVGAAPVLPAPLGIYAVNSATTGNQGVIKKRLERFQISKEDKLRTLKKQA